MGKCWVGVIGHLGTVSEKHKQLATVLGKQLTALVNCSTFVKGILNVV